MIKKKCEHCGEKYTTTSGTQKICFDCRKEEVKCLNCGKSFISYNLNSGKFRTTCSQKCKNTLNGKVKKTNFDYADRECLHCKKIYKPISTQQKFCSKACMAKFRYQKDIEKHQKRSKIRVKISQLGMDIKDEYMGNPTDRAKWLWDGVGKWSVKYWPDITECLECNTNVYKHKANGICALCYEKMRWRNENELKEYKAKKFQEYKQSGHKFTRDISNEWIKKAKNREIEVNNKIENILENIDHLKGRGSK